MELRAVLLAAAMASAALLQPVYAHASTVALHNSKSAVYLYPGNALSVLVDPKRSFTIGEVSRATGFTAMHALDDRHAAYWLRFSYTTAGTNKDWYLFLGYKPETADLYIPNGGGGYSVQHSGIAIPYADRPAKYYGAVVFPLPPAPKPTVVYARITTLEPEPTAAIDSHALLERVNRISFAIIVGLDAVLIALLISSLTFFLMSHSRIYLLYAAYLVAELIYRSNDRGFAAAILWPHLALSTLRLGGLLDGVRIVAATLFIRAFLRIREHSPWLDRAMLAVAGLCLLLGIATFGELPVRASWLSELALVYVPLWLIASFVAWRKGETQAMLIVVGWSLFMLFSMSFGLKQLGFGRGNLAEELIVSQGSYFGVALQTLFLSLALASDLRRLTVAKDRYAQLAATDPLTGVSNRRVFEEVLRREWNRALRNRRPLSLLMIDVDLFKSYNDRNGHRAGDAVLERVSQVGAAVMRSADLFCRYGGEEFVAILPETDETSAMLVAERLRTAIADLQITHTGSPHQVVTVSVGAATERPGEGHDPTELCDRADQACYAAKARGRNATAIGHTADATSTTAAQL